MKPTETVILLAEDDKSITEVISIILQDEGYKVRAVQSYRDLKKILKDENVALLLLDLWLSGENGSDICKTIKSDNETKHIPVIILSAHQNVESIAKEVSADSSLQKPFDIDVLIKKVKQFAI